MSVDCGLAKVVLPTSKGTSLCKNLQHSASMSCDGNSKENSAEAAFKKIWEEGTCPQTMANQSQQWFDEWQAEVDAGICNDSRDGFKDEMVKWLQKALRVNISLRPSHQRLD